MQQFIDILREIRLTYRTYDYYSAIRLYLQRVVIIPRQRGAIIIEASSAASDASCIEARLRPEHEMQREE